MEGKVRVKFLGDLLEAFALESVVTASCSLHCAVDCTDFESASCEEVLHLYVWFPH